MFKKKIFAAQLNYKKELLIQVVMMILIVVSISALAFLYNKYFYFFYIPFALIVYYFFLNQKYEKVLHENIFKKQKEFVKLFTYFEIFIYNGFNVYRSLTILNDFTSPLVKNDLDILIAQIDEDKTIRPFLTFGRTFSLLAIEQAMVAIYLMIDQGSNLQRLSQFSLLFEKITFEHYEKEKHKKIKSFDNLNIYPLLGAGLITVMITFGIMMSIGGLVGGF